MLFLCQQSYFSLKKKIKQKQKPKNIYNTVFTCLSVLLPEIKGLQNYTLWIDCHVDKNIQ